MKNISAGKEWFLCPGSITINYQLGHVHQIGHVYSFEYGSEMFVYKQCSRRFIKLATQPRNQGKWAI